MVKVCGSIITMCENSRDINSMKKHIRSTLENLESENFTDQHSARENLEYQIGTFSKTFYKETAHLNKI